MKNKSLFQLLIFASMLYSCATPKEQIYSNSNNSDDHEKTWGLDISHYQEVKDWEKVKAHDMGFIFVKATEGSTIQDSKYLEYYNQIRKLSIPVGSYHFFTYMSSGKNQAKNFLSTVKYQRGDLPLVLDAEFSKKMPEKELVIKELKDFVASVYHKTRFYPIIYCPINYYKLYVKDHLPKNCKLWIVDYVSRPNCDWTFWQTTEKYTVHGIKGYIDFNQFNGTKKDLRKLLL